MFTNHLFTLSVIIALGMRSTTKFLLTASILVGIGKAGLPPTKPFTYTTNGYTVVRPSELGPLTGIIDDSPPAPGPGHDYGAINGASGPGMSLPALQSPFTYTVNGYTVVRSSELGPLTGTIDDSPPAPGPGHDYGAINGASDPGMSLPATQPPFTYTVNGYTVVRPSELGPLTGTVDNSPPVPGPGHDYGAINGTNPC